MHTIRKKVQNRPTLTCSGEEWDFVAERRRIEKLVGMCVCGVPDVYVVCVRDVCVCGVYVVCVRWFWWV